MTRSNAETTCDPTLLALLRAAEEGLISVAADGSLSFVNPAASQLLDLDAENIVGQEFSALSAPALVERIRKTLGPGGRAASVRVELGERMLSCRVARSSARDGGVIVTVRDETELVDERDRTEAILAATGDGLVLLSPDDEITYINPAACEMLRVKPSRIVGTRASIDALLGVETTRDPKPQARCSEIKHCGRPECPAYTSAELRCWLVTGTLCHPEEGPCTFEKKREECQSCDYHVTYAEAFDPLDADSVSEVELPHDETNLVVKARVSAVVDDAGNYIGRVLALRDITAEREIADMKNEFVSTVSHELRTPLTSIKGYVDLILDGSAGEISEIQAEFLGIVKENSDRLVELINEMLDISRIESGRVHLKVEPLDIAESVRGAVDTFRDFVIVSVTDQGLGISREDQKRLFTKFYRVDTAMTREIGGTGLGLSICKTILELLGGTIGVKSTAGKGSTFWFSLPVAPDELVRTPSLEGPDSVGGTVLVIDRDPDVADLIEAYLVKRGYDVVKAHTADEALVIALKVRPRAITLDVILDEGDGFDLLHRLKEHDETRDIPVVVLSIVCDEGKSCRMGAANYLEKPIDHNRLLSMIDDIVGGVDSPVALVVDDDQSVVKVLSETLRRKGFAVVAAYNGLEAVAALGKRIPDIIVTDLRMPKMDGYELIQRVKTTPEWVEIPILVMTAHRLDRSRIDVLHLATQYMRKPFSPELIADEVEMLLGGPKVEVTA